jgi:hypothetical protein
MLETEVQSLRLDELKAKDFRATTQDEVLKKLVDSWFNS